MKLSLAILNKIGACEEAVTEYKKSRPDTVEAATHALLDSRLPNRYEWANWLLSRMLPRKQKITYAIFAAEQVIDIFERKYPDDKRPRQAIEAAKEYLKKQATKNRGAAEAAAWAARVAAGGVTEAAAWAAGAAEAAAWAAGVAWAARTAAGGATEAATWVVEAAWAAAWDAAWDATRYTRAAAYNDTLKKIILFGLSLIKKKI